MNESPIINNNYYKIRKTKYFYISIILIIYFPEISCNFITMKFKGIGKESIFMNQKMELNVLIEYILIEN